MSEPGISKSQWLREELHKYALISAYLFVCFAVVLLYQNSIVNADASDPVPWGIALVKALVLGKFILIGHALSVGSRADSHPLLHRILWKSVAMLLLLVAFKVLEEVIVGMIHRQGMGHVLHELIARSWIQNLAPILLMLLILVPLMSATEIYRAIGSERFQQILSGR